MELQAFLKEHAPCYLYDQSRILAQCAALKKALPGFTFLYSVKTNPYPPILRDLCRQGFGADAASAREALLAGECGMPPELIFYSAPGKTGADLEAAWGRCVLTADSLGELRRIDEEAGRRGETVPVGVRLNPCFSMYGEPAGPSKFGIDEECLPELEALLRECPHIRVTGVHIHIRSQVMDAGLLGRYYQNCFRLAERLNRLEGAELSFVNFGSGIGALYNPERDRPVDLEQLSAAAAEIVRENAAGLKARLYIETGRFIVCNAGTYYTRIVDIKVSRGRKYLVVQNGINGFLRPSLACLLPKTAGQTPLTEQEPFYTCPDEYAVSVLNDAARRETVTVAGNLCTALDLICENVSLNQAAEGDLVSITNAGSYAYSLSPLLFSSHPLPGQYYLKEDGTVE